MYEVFIDLIKIVFCIEKNNSYYVFVKIWKYLLLLNIFVFDIFDLCY